jgi:hypothetical protein
MNATLLNITRIKLISLTTILPVFVTLTMSLSAKANDDEYPLLDSKDIANIRCLLPESFESEPEVEGSFLPSNDRLYASLNIKGSVRFSVSC